MNNDTFKNSPDLNEYFETSDGQKFYKEDLARNHGRTLENKDVQTVCKSQDLESARLTVKEMAALIPDMDIESANEYLEAENHQDPRKTVVTALTKRIAELEGAEDTDPGNEDSEVDKKDNPED